MTRFLDSREIIRLHSRLISSTGGAPGIRDSGALESAIAQPRATFDGAELHPTLVDKAAALGFSLARGHPFVDGNKRVAHAAMEVFLILNNFEIDAPVDDQERLMLGLAEGQIRRTQLADWLRRHLKPLDVSRD